MATTSANSSVPAPPFRRLRVFSFDPSLNTQLDTAVLNQVVVKVPWERAGDPGELDAVLGPGPVGDYLEVVDHDPATGCYYAPVDLNDPHLLAQDGLAPSESNPQFHQQMVYAVAMTTIRAFEKALGRRAVWAERWVRNEQGAVVRNEYVHRLRLYPHALREANAYYSPNRVAVLFGYFPASGEGSSSVLPGGTVFTCLSYDIIAHEVAHALLDGMHRRFHEPTNRDVLAFHEAFADLVALFQHFSHADVLRHQIARTRGDLASQNLLGQLAQQFGQAVGRYGALRDALGRVNPQTRAWEPVLPDPVEYDRTTEPHALGAILVAAVFDAFLTIYRSRIADLLRIATGGSGHLPPGELHPDLVGRLAAEAASVAGHVLRMCIRALDYCPPVGLTFGDYLRALITADAELVPDDDRNYRLAFIEAFRRRGIYPQGVRILSTDSLCWPPAGGSFPNFKELIGKLSLDWDLTADRRNTYERMKQNRRLVNEWFTSGKVSHEAFRAMGLVMEETAPAGVYRKKDSKIPSLEVHSLRPARRVSPDGDFVIDLVIELLQRRRGYLDEETQRRADAGEFAELPAEDFRFRGGCTLLVNVQTGQARYCVTRDVLDGQRLAAQRRFLGSPESQPLRDTYFKTFDVDGGDEPFALLHRDTPG